MAANSSSECMNDNEKSSNDGDQNGSKRVLELALTVTLTVVPAILLVSSVIGGYSLYKGKLKSNIEGYA